MEKVAGRIRWVVESGKVANARAWCEAAGISSSYLGTFLSRDRKGQESDIAVGIVVKLARAAGLSVAWLAAGEGEPLLRPTLPPNLAALIERRPELSAVLVQQAALVLKLTGDTDLTIEHWQDYIDGLRREARRVGLEAAASRLDDRGVRAR